MTSSGAERSLSNISLPQWMKSKIGDRYDLDQNAFSPPTDDDGFLHMRYKRAPLEQETKPVVVKAGNVNQQKNQDTSISKLVSEKMHISDTIRHTLPCQQFIPKAKVSPREIGLKYGEIDPQLGRVTSLGTDDGFKGEGAACGYSVVAVAHQMIAERKGDRMTVSRQRVRRNSKSLPASPQSSPQIARKNPFFTNVIFGSTECVDNTNNNTLSNDVKNWEAKFAEIQKAKQESVKALQAKPSELREMNFWSPTSM